MKKFTLIELLIVIVIIAILVSMLLPSLNSAKNKARIITCASNAKQTSTGVTMFVKDNDGKFPDVYNSWGNNPFHTRTGYWTSTDKYYNLGEVYSNNYLTDARVFYCPQHVVKGVKWLTYDNYNGADGRWAVQGSDFYLRTSFNLLVKRMTTDERRAVKVHQLDTQTIFLIDGIESARATAHSNKPGWNVTLLDMSVRFVKSQEAYDILVGGKISNDWGRGELVIDAIFSDM